MLGFLWAAFCIGGCAYLVFWRGQSPWWFLLAAILAQLWTEHREDEEDETDEY